MKRSAMTNKIEEMVGRVRDAQAKFRDIHQRRLALQDQLADTSKEEREAEDRLHDAWGVLRRLIAEGDSL